MGVPTVVQQALEGIRRGNGCADDFEGQLLDFKQEKPDPKETQRDLAEAAICLANGAGGSLVVGVADKGRGSSALLGSTLDPTELRARIHALTEPPLTVMVDEVQFEGRRLLIVSVPQGIDVYATKKGASTRRVNDECLPMRPDEIARLHEERRGVDWSAGSSGVAVSSTDPDAMTIVRSLLRSSQDQTRNRLALAVDEDILAALHLVHSDGHLTNAGRLMLCADSGSTSPVLIYQARNTPGGEATFVRRWDAPLLVAFTEAMEVISARLGVTPVTMPSGQQLQIEDYPFVAVREAVANALLHGDHRDLRPVEVEHSPEQLVVRSPGPLVTGITPENILTAGSRARFPSLAATARSLGIAEELGQGVDRMFREMVRSGKETPTVAVESESGADRTIVTFKGGAPNARLARYVAGLPDIERDDTDALLILHLLCRRRSVTAHDVAPIIQRPTETTEAVLRRLALGSAEMIEATPGTSARAHPNYRLRGPVLAALGSSVAYHRRTPSETDRKVVEHVREYETINSATVQRLFDVDVYQARDLLRDLVGREILVRTSTQMRGPAVKYGPGAAFPAKERRKRR